VQTAIRISDSHKAKLGVIVPIIRNDNGIRPSEIGGTFERQLPFGLIPGIFLESNPMFM
jgi:hypothetical protein